VLAGTDQLEPAETALLTAGSNISTVLADQKAELERDGSAKVHAALEHVGRC
jgi:hypothetical protein